MIGFCVRSRMWLLMCLICLTQLVVAKAATPSKAPAPLVVVIDLHDTMQPTWADVFVNSLARANQRHAAAILINLSSAGGMKQSVDRMVAAMQKSRVPIIVVGATGDTRVTGEALRLMAEADLPLMGHKGYLTPLWTELPRQLTPEQRHAASTSLMHSLADSLNRHHRRLDAVDELSSGIHWFRADEAVSMGFVEGTVEKQADVLRYMKEKGYRKNGETVHLDLTGAHVEQDTPAPQTSLLLALMNPNLCVLLLTLGLLLIYLEINTPGVVVPGVTGVLLVLLSIYGLSRLPLNLYGIALCVLSLVLMALEAKMSSRGLLAMAGVICMMLGFGYLVRGPIPELQVNWGTALELAWGLAG